MKKIFIITTYLLFLSLITFPQSEWEYLSESQELYPEIKIIEQTSNYLTIKLSVNSYKFEEVESPRGNEVILLSPEFNSSLQKGFPDIPIFTKSINIPNDSDFSFELVSSSFKTLENISIAPSKGVLYRNVNPDDIPYEYAEIYNTDVFFPEDAYSHSEPFFIRDMRGLTLNFSPFIYNALRKELKIYTEIIIKLNLTNNIKKSLVVKKQNSEEFNNIYNRLFLNYNSFSENEARYTPLQEGNPGRMLIITKDEFEPVMQEFVAWKREKGIITEIVKMSEIGSTSTDVKKYIANTYNSKNDLIYVLLVGDHDGVPTTIVKNGGGGNTGIGAGHNDLDSDNKYAYIVGNDKFADVFIGRFSGKNIAHIETQVKRSIYYEKSLNKEDTWLETSLSSASNEGSGPSDAQHLDAINTKLQGFGFTTTVVNQNGGDNAKISTAINNGVALANYTGHGTVKTWSNTTFHNSDVKALQNKNKLPFVWSVACLNGQFRGSDCFAEAWLQASKDGEPTGAIAFLGSTILQAWDPPMYGQREMNDILVESYNNNIKRTIGGISFNGLFKIIEKSPNDNSRTVDTWTLFGDPSLMIRTKTPSENIVIHPDVLILGQNQIDIRSNTEGALATLSARKDNITRILGSAFISDGTAQINFDKIFPDDEIKLTLTAYNKTTYQKTLNVINPEGPYIAQTGFTINDSESGNNNKTADYNEKFKINQTFKNLGVDKATQVKAEITTEDSFITIIKSSVEVGEIIANQSLTINNAFEISISEDVKDQQIGILKIKITDDKNNIWNSTLNFIINAPKVDLEIKEIINSNGQSNFSKGDEISIKVDISNIGHSKSKEGKMKISSKSSFLNFINPEINFDPIDEKSSFPAEFKIRIDEKTPVGLTIDFFITTEIGSETFKNDSLIVVGKQIETWESNNTDSFYWINDENIPWQIVSSEKYQGEYSLKSGELVNKGDETSFKINLTTLYDNDEIKFMLKVALKEGNSGAPTYSHFYEFYINDKLTKTWNSNRKWAEESFTLGKKGDYEIKWKLRKSKTATSDFNAFVYLDNILLPTHKNDKVSNIVCNKITENNTIEIYPNPATDILNVRIDSENETKVSIKIININGQVVYQHNNNSMLLEGFNLIPIDVQQLTNGTYIVQITTDKEIKNKRLIINR